jgi:hypothetical protein
MEPEAVPPLPAPDEIRRAAEEVLKRPDYQLDGGAYDVTPFLRALHRFTRWTEDSIRRMDEISPLLKYLVALLLFLVLMALIAHIVLTFRAALASRRTKVPGFGRPGAPEDPAEVEARARAAAAGGGYLLAVRLLFRAGLLRLFQASGRVLARGATNGEILRLFRGTPARPPLEELVALLHAKWYGGGACGASDYEAALRAHAALRQAAEGMRHAHRP